MTLLNQGKLTVLDDVVETFPVLILAIKPTNIHAEKSGPKTKGVDIEQKIGKVHDENLQKQLETCKHFLVDFEKANEKHISFIFAMDSHNPHLLNGKPDIVFESFKSANKLNIAFGCVLKKITGR